MFKKLTGILLLLSFLLIKYAPLFIADNHKETVSVYSNDQDSESPDDEKEVKQFEFTDDFIHQPLLNIIPILLSKKIKYSFLARTTTAVIFAAYPPPDNIL